LHFSELQGSQDFGTTIHQSEQGGGGAPYGFQPPQPSINRNYSVRQKHRTKDQSYCQAIYRRGKDPFSLYKLAPHPTCLDLHSAGRGSYAVGRRPGHLLSRRSKRAVQLIEVTKMQCIRAKNSEEKREATAQQTGGAWQDHKEMLCEVHGPKQRPGCGHKPVKPFGTSSE
jgi:hypothetical protein